MECVLLRLRLVLAALTFAWCGSASAYWIGLAPPTTTVAQNGAFSTAVVISGLQTDGQVLSTYDFTVGFDPAVLQLVDAQSSGALGAGAFFAFSTGIGSVNLFEFSFDSDAQLAAQQGDLFTIATLVFSGIGVGTSPIVFSTLFALGGSQYFDPALGEFLTTDLLALPHTVGSATATVTTATVSEPGTLLLLLAAIPLLSLRLNGRRI